MDDHILTKKPSRLPSIHSQSSLSRNPSFYINSASNSFYTSTETDSHPTLRRGHLIHSSTEPIIDIQSLSINSPSNNNSFYNKESNHSPSSNYHPVPPTTSPPSSISIGSSSNSPNSNISPSLRESLKLNLNFDIPIVDGDIESDSDSETPSCPPVTLSRTVSTPSPLSGISNKKRIDSHHLAVDQVLDGLVKAGLSPFSPRDNHLPKSLSFNSPRFSPTGNTELSFKSSINSPNSLSARTSSFSVLPPISSSSSSHNLLHTPPSTSRLGIPSHMKAFVAKGKFKNMNDISIETVPVPTLNSLPQSVLSSLSTTITAWALVKVRAVSLCAADPLMMARLLVSPTWSLPHCYTPGLQFSGTIKEIYNSQGEKINSWKVVRKNIIEVPFGTFPSPEEKKEREIIFSLNDDVFGSRYDLNLQRILCNAFGIENYSKMSIEKDSLPFSFVGQCLSEYIIVPLNSLSLKPPTITHAEASSLPINGGVAYDNLHNIGKVIQDSKVLVLGGGGVVGCYFIQLLKSIKAWIAVTSGEWYGDNQEKSGESESNHAFNDSKGRKIIEDILKSCNIHLPRHFPKKFYDEVSKNSLLKNIHSKSFNHEFINYHEASPSFSLLWQNHPKIKNLDFILDIEGKKDSLSTLKLTPKLINVGASFSSLTNTDVGFQYNQHPPFSYTKFYEFQPQPSINDKLIEKYQRKQLVCPISCIVPFNLQYIAHAMQLIRERKFKGVIVINMDEVV